MIRSVDVVVDVVVADVDDTAAVDDHMVVDVYIVVVVIDIIVEVVVDVVVVVVVARSLGAFSAPMYCGVLYMLNTS